MALVPMGAPGATSPGNWGPGPTSEGHIMSTGKHVHDDHGHEHGDGCVHDGHCRAAHGDHYDEH